MQRIEFATRIFELEKEARRHTNNRILFRLDMKNGADRTVGQKHVSRRRTARANEKQQAEYEESRLFKGAAHGSRNIARYRHPMT